MTAPLTLGGLRPGCAYWVIPHQHQLWWKPCLTRGEAGREHCWYLSPTSDGSLFCWTCRVGQPRVFIGPTKRVAEIKSALEEGDLARAQALAFDNAQLVDEPADPRPWAEYWDEEFGERAGILEFMAGYSRTDAEKIAKQMLGPRPGDG